MEKKKKKQNFLQTTYKIRGIQLLYFIFIDPEQKHKCNTSQEKKEDCL